MSRTDTDSDSSEEKNGEEDTVKSSSSQRWRLVKSKKCLRPKRS